MNNLSLIDRLRLALVDIPNIEEKKMFSGTTFMVNGKMCISVSNEVELMCRIDPAEHETVIEKMGCREMIHGGKAMKGFIYVSEEAYQKPEDFAYWIKLCLDYNPRAKASKKKS